MVKVVGVQQPSESQSERLFPRFDALVKPAFLSIAGSIPPFILAAYVYTLNSDVNYGASWLVSLLYGNIGSVLLAYSIVALVARVQRGLWGFFIVLYSVLNGILGLFLFGFGYPYEILIPILALGGPIAGFIGGILGAVWPKSSGPAKVGTTQPTGASLVVSGGILLSSLSLWLVLFAGATVVITFFAGTALVLLGLLLRGGQLNHPAIGRAVVVTTTQSPSDRESSCGDRVGGGDPSPHLCDQCDRRRVRNFGRSLADGSSLECARRIAHTSAIVCREGD